MTIAGQLNRKDRSPAYLALRGDFTAVRFNDGFGNGQA
jgi:hypothetical protein